MEARNRARRPLEVKQLIWEHERDELIGIEREGKQDHITLAVQKTKCWD